MLDIYFYSAINNMVSLFEALKILTFLKLFMKI